MSRNKNQNCAARILRQCRSVFTANTSICVDRIGTNGNKNNLRTIEAQIVQTLKGQMTHTFFFAENLKFGRFRRQLETLKFFFDLTFCLRENAI